MKTSIMDYSTLSTKTVWPESAKYVLPRIHVFILIHYLLSFWTFKILYNFKFHFQIQSEECNARQSQLILDPTLGQVERTLLPNSSSNWLNIFNILWDLFNMANFLLWPYIVTSIKYMVRVANICGHTWLKSDDLKNNYIQTVYYFSSKDKKSIFIC